MGLFNLSPHATIHRRCFYFEDDKDPSIQAGRCDFKFFVFEFQAGAIGDFAKKGNKKSPNGEFGRRFKIGEAIEVRRSCPVGCETLDRTLSGTVIGTPHVRVMSPESDVATEKFPVDGGVSHLSDALSFKHIRCHPAEKRR
jgi:hypothetical protein